MPKTFILELTQDCNNKCLYCYNPWLAEEHTYPRGTMSCKEIKELVTKLKQETEIENIGLSGGEPFLRQDLPEIVSFIREMKINPVIITNGTLLSEENVAATGAAASYEVPLLSYRKEVHNRMVGRDVFDSVLEGISNIKNCGGNFIAVFVATKLNYSDLFATVKLAIAMGAIGLMYNRVNITPYNMKYADMLFPTPAMLKENLNILEELSEQYNLIVSSSIPIPPCILDISKYKQIKFGWCPRGGKDSYYTIDSLGNLRICNHSAVILGNLRRQKFSDILTHSYVTQYQESLPEECINCTHPLKPQCWGGCRAASEVCYGNLKTVDPFVRIYNSRLVKDNLVFS